MADAVDVVDSASMVEECPTTLTPPSPPILSFNQNVVVDINVVKAKTFFCFMSMILGQFMQMVASSKWCIKQMVAYQANGASSKWWHQANGASSKWWHQANGASNAYKIM
jgi:hypothetical protein